MASLNFIAAMMVSEAYSFKAGPLGIEGYYMNGVLGNKPYSKIYAQSMGVLLAFAYFDLLKYRELESDSEK